MRFWISVISSRKRESESFYRDGSYSWELSLSTLCPSFAVPFPLANKHSDTTKRTDYTHINTYVFTPVCTRTRAHIEWKMKHITKEERNPPYLPQSSCFSKYTYGAYPFSSLYFSRRLLFSRAISSLFSRAATHRLVRLAIEGGKRTKEGSWGEGKRRTRQAFRIPRALKPYFKSI